MSVMKQETIKVADKPKAKPAKTPLKPVGKPLSGHSGYHRLRRAIQFACFLIFVALPFFNVMVGRQWHLGSGFHFGLSAGVMIPLKPRASVSLGGRAEEIATVISGAEAAFDGAAESMRRNAQEGLERVVEKITLAPSLLLTVGWSF